MMRLGWVSLLFGWACVLSQDPAHSDVSKHGSCMNNNLVQAFNFAYPTEGILVPRNMYVKVAGDFYDPSYIVQNNAQYSVCVGLNGIELWCTEQLFDEITIRLPEEAGWHEISAAFCPKQSKICLCNITMRVECCGQSYITTELSKPSESTLLGIQRLENKLRSEGQRAPPPWSCRYFLYNSRLLYRS